jgi:hypothetical protein
MKTSLCHNNPLNKQQTMVNLFTLFLKILKWNIYCIYICGEYWASQTNVFNTQYALVIKSWLKSFTMKPLWRQVRQHCSTLFNKSNCYLHLRSIWTYFRGEMKQFLKMQVHRNYSSNDSEQCRHYSWKIQDFIPSGSALLGRRGEVGDGRLQLGWAGLEQRLDGRLQLGCAGVVELGGGSGGMRPRVWEEIGQPERRGLNLCRKGIVRIFSLAQDLESYRSHRNLIVFIL